MNWNDFMGGVFIGADACELMAKNHSKLIEERDRYYRWYKDEQAEKNRSYRRNSALKGVITKLKNKR